MLVIFFTVLIDLIGFGIVLPLLPLFSRDFGANGFVIGAIMAAYSAMQFVFSPIWGRLSDRVGRRPVLLISTAFASVSYIVFAVGSSFEGNIALFVFFGSRILAGICGANITVAQAYIADITPLQDRSKRMGLIGMAFGLGFIIGPALGAVSVTYLGVSGPGWTAAVLCAMNFLMTLTLLGESWRPNSEHVKPRPRLDQWAHTLRQPSLALLIGIFFFATFCFTCFETTLGLVVGANFHLDPARKHDSQMIGYLFAYCGVIGVIIQGGAIGYLVRRFGEPRIIATSMLLLAVSLAPIPFLANWTTLFVTLAVLALASSLTRPPVFGMLSMLAPPHEQGSTIGVAQSAGSLARILGPIFAGSLYQYHPSLIYLACSGISLATGLVAWQYLTHHQQPIQQATETQDLAV